jgi:hypothetical protein
MAQVVTSENFQQLIDTGKVDEFKAPDKAVETKVEETKTEGATAEKVDVNAVDKTEEDDDKDLSERVRLKIGKKHREKMEAEEFAEQQYNERKAAERRADKLERELEESRAKSRPVTVEAVKPKPEDFKTVQEYDDAVIEWKVDQKLAQKEQEKAQNARAEEAKRVKEDFSKRIADTMKELPDYEEVTGAVDVELPPHITSHIIESDVGPLLGYHLAKYPDELNRILKLSPIRAIAELGKLEAKLEKPKPQLKVVESTKEVSKAPAPITPIEGKTTPVVTDPSKMNFDQLLAHRRAEAAKKR